MKAAEKGKTQGFAPGSSGRRKAVSPVSEPNLDAAVDQAVDPALDPALRMGGIALNNGLILVSPHNWAAAVRESDGAISVASGRKPQFPGTGEGEREGIPLVRGLGRLAETLRVLGIVKKRLPSAQLPFEGSHAAAALATSVAAGSAVRLVAPRSALAQEMGHVLAAFIPAMVAVKKSPASGYHGAEHKVIGAREEALRAAVRQQGAVEEAPAATGDATAAAKEHDRCGTNLVGPLLVATVLTNVFVRDKRGRRTPWRSAAAGAASLGIALEAMRWASRHADSLLARLMLMPGRAAQKSFTTREPTPEQLEVGERALAELLRLENAGV